MGSLFLRVSLCVFDVLVFVLELNAIFQGIGPTNILAMTFTTAAASEMRDRIGAVAGKEAAKQLMISTFHSFSLQLCRTHADKYAYNMPPAL